MHMLVIHFTVNYRYPPYINYFQYRVATLLAGNSKVIHFEFNRHCQGHAPPIVIVGYTVKLEVLPGPISLL